MTTHGKVQFRSSVGPAGCRRRLAGSGTGDEKRGREPFRRLSRHHRRLAEKGDADFFGDFPIANFAWREKRGRESVRLLCSRHPRLASSQAKDRKLPAESLPVFLASEKVRVPFFCVPLSNIGRTHDAHRCAFCLSETFLSVAHVIRRRAMSHVNGAATPPSPAAITARRQ
jgi:hypothetical protein